jgi:hypothetical protein
METRGIRQAEKHDHCTIKACYLGHEKATAKDKKNTQASIEG